MKGNPRVIEYLNKALTSELTAVNQYWLHYRLLDDWGYTKLAKKEREELIEEMHHADKLVTRIIFLEGFPNLQVIDPLMIGQNVKEILECDLKAEYGARALYMEARACCRKEEDYVSMDLFEELLGDEEGHINYLEFAAQPLERHRRPELRPAQRPFRRRGARGGRLSLALPLDGPRLPPAAGGAARQLVVFLHGYGADGNDLIGLGREWAKLLPHAAFVSPHAPEPCGAAPMGRQWFNLTFRDASELVRGVKQASPALDAFLDAELKRHNLPARALALVGFSQGTMMALGVGLRRRPAPAAIVGYSGALATVEALPKDPGIGAGDPARAWRHGRAHPGRRHVHGPRAAGAGGPCRGVARGARHRPRHRRPRPASRRRLSEAGLRRRRSAHPRIVSAEGPDMAFEVAAGIVAPAIILRLELEHDLGAFRLGARVMAIDVGDDHIVALRDGLSFEGRRDQMAILGLDVAKHDHAVAENELGMGDAVALAWHHHLLRETESLAEPVDGGFRVAVAQGRDDPPAPFPLQAIGHAVLLSPDSWRSV